MSTTSPKKTTSPVIRLATPADRDNVIAALTAGFSDDVIISGWLISDPDTYAHYASGYFSCYTDYALEHGYVLTTGDETGAHINMPFQAWQRAQQDTGLKDRLIETTGPFFEKVYELDEALAKRHPTSPDHLYLCYTGVAPGHRDKKIGTQLLQAAFDIADRLQVPCYGEASCERNARLYDRIGLFVQDDYIWLPGAETGISPLWRPQSSVTILESDAEELSNSEL